MTYNYSKRLLHGVSFVLLVAALPGCAASGAHRVAVAGDEVGVQFTCRLPGGEIAVSTKADAGRNDGERLSALFMPRETSDPIILSAGAPDPLLPNKIRPMEEDILQQLRGAVIGMKQGELRNVELHATRPQSEKPTEGIVKMNRTLHYAKEERIALAAFREEFGKDPVAGTAFPSATHEPEFKAMVDQVTDQEAVIRYSIEPGTKVPVFFGTGTVADAGDTYDLRIVTEEGRLVRNGYLTGRVLQVTDQTVAIDFGDLFGGVALGCQLRVDSVQPAAAALPIAASADASGQLESAKE